MLSERRKYSQFKMKVCRDDSNNSLTVEINYLQNLTKSPFLLVWPGGLHFKLMNWDSDGKSVTPTDTPLKSQYLWSVGCGGWPWLHPSFLHKCVIKICLKCTKLEKLLLIKGGVSILNIKCPYAPWHYLNQLIIYFMLA